MITQYPPATLLPFPLAGFTPPDSDEDVDGINVVYLVDRAVAGPGELLTFTAWILNGTAETLTDVSLRLRSLQNGGLAQLECISQPSIKELVGRVLGPRQSLSFTLSYRVTEEDQRHQDMIISALQVELTSPNAGRLHSECDAMVAVSTPVGVPH
jgi:hypothetical protein